MGGGDVLRATQGVSENGYYFLIKFFHQKGSTFGVTDSVFLIKSRNLVS